MHNKCIAIRQEMCYYNFINNKFGGYKMQQRRQRLIIGIFIIITLTSGIVFLRLNEKIALDTVSQSMYTVKKREEKLYFTDICPAYEFDSLRYEESTYSNRKYFIMGGEGYVNGFIVTPYNYNSIMALYNLNGKYNTLSFTAGHIDGTANQNIQFKVYADEIIVMNIDLKYNELPKNYSVNLVSVLYKY